MKTCPRCKKMMKPYLSGHHPPASEWYCEPCHHSIFMTEEERRQVLHMLSQPQMRQPHGD